MDKKNDFLLNKITEILQNNTKLFSSSKNSKKILAKKIILFLNNNFAISFKEKN